MYYNDETYLFLDGEFLKAKDAKIDLFSQTMHYGTGVFEGMRAYETSHGTKIFKATEHFDRLKYSAEKMHIPFTWNIEDLKKATYELLDRNNLTNAYIRPLIYLPANMSLTKTEGAYITIQAWEWGKLFGSELMKVTLSPYQRPNPKSVHVEAKVTGHYVNSILATNEAKSRGFDEALLLDSFGFVAEGPGANFFYEKDDKLYTPPAGNILPGITRATILELAAEVGMEVEEKHFTLEQIRTADSAFFVGTAAEVAGIKSIDDYIFPLEWENSLGAQLAKKYRLRVTREELHNVALV